MLNRSVTLFPTFVKFSPYFIHRNVEIILILTLNQRGIPTETQIRFRFYAAIHTVRIVRG